MSYNGWKSRWRASGLSAAMLALLFSPPAAAKPNIVVVITDDLDLASTRVLLAQGWMPHLKKWIVERGVTFDQMFVTTSSCCPSRATFFTGQYVHNHNVRTSDPPLGGVSMFEDRSTLATWLRAAGYRTSLVGKYLNGYGKRDSNRDGELNTKDLVYIPPGWTDFQVLLDPTAALMLNYTINDNGQLVAAGGLERDYQTDVLTLRAIRFIDESEKTDDAAPFFLYVAPVAPHQGELFADAEPVGEDDYSYFWRWTIRPASRYKGTISLPLPQLPSFNEADISDKPSWLQLRPQLTPLDAHYAGRLYRDRLESMRSVDDMVGGIIAALARNGELQNTVLIFTSDNGFLMGEHRLPQKMAPYEESVRVPLVVAVPGYLGGLVSNGVVLNTDLAPTIAHLAGVTPGLTADGVSLVPLLTQPNVRWRQRLLIEHWMSDMGIFAIPDFGAVRTAPNATTIPNLLYAEYGAGAGQALEMYDMTADPHQLRSIHADSSSSRTNQRKLLKAWLDALRTCTGRGCSSLEF